MKITNNTSDGVRSDTSNEAAPNSHVDKTAITIYTTAELSRLNEIHIVMSVEERAAELKRRGLSTTAPAQQQSTDKTIRVHECFEYLYENKPARCNCNLMVTQEEADEIIRSEKGEMYAYEKLTHGVKRVCISKRVLVLYTSAERRAEIAWSEEVEKNLRKFEFRQQQREQTFQSKLPRFIRDFKRLAYRLGLRDAHQFSDAQIVRACEDEGNPVTGACTMNGLIPEGLISYFYGLLGRFWELILNRENCHESNNHVPMTPVDHGWSGSADGKVIPVYASTGRGDRPVGSNQRFIMGGSTADEGDGIIALEKHMVDDNGSPLYGEGRVVAGGAGPDVESGKSTPEPYAPAGGQYDPIADFLSKTERTALKDLKVYGCPKNTHLRLVTGKSKPVECTVCGHLVYPI